jgi:calreticulin
MKVALALLGLLAAASATTYYKEQFADGDAWTKRWVQSSWKKSSGEAGSFQLTAGKWYGDADDDKGIQTSADARFYAWSSKLKTPFSNEGKTLVLQFSVKHEQSIDCGGGYVKVMGDGLDQSDFKGDTDYFIMFGPDICGTSTRKVHVIFGYKGKNHLIKKEISAESDALTHVYTLIVKPDQTYEVRIDGNKKESGSLTDDWDFLAPKKIKDPKVSKPSDWVDEPMMEDPSDVKPEDYDSVPKQISDPDAKKPEDWDDEADGAWEAPKIDNPEFKGDWKPKKIKNPAYKGKWEHPEIDNPEYVADDKIYAFKNIGFVGFDLWQVKAGSIFDNIIITDSVAEAEALLDQTYKANKDGEKKMHDDVDKKKRDEEEAQRKKSEEERKKKEADEEEDDEEEEDDKKSDKDEL